MEKKALRQEFMDRMLPHQGIIHKVCRSYLQEHADQKELFQEICLQLWRSYPTFSGKAKFTTWMYTVALNTAITFQRRRLRQPVHDSLASWENRLPGPESPTPAASEKELLFQAIRQLNEIERALIMLWLDDKSYEEIAEILGIKRTLVSVRLVRIKEKLKALIPGLTEQGG